MAIKLQYNEILAKEFSQLGFHESREMIENARSFDTWSSIEKTERLLAAPYNGTQSVDYSFTVDHNANHGNGSITMFTAILKKELYLDGERFNMKSNQYMFGIESGPLPSKYHLLQRFQDLLKQYDQISNTVKVLRVGQLNMDRHLWGEIPHNAARTKKGI